MNQEVKDYLNEKLYSAKKGMVALALCGAATLALTGCGKDNSNESMFPPPLYATEQQIEESNIYRLHTEKGYMDFDIVDIDRGSYKGSTYNRYQTNTYDIEFDNSGCQIYDRKTTTLLYSFTDAYIEKLDTSFEWQGYNENENATNPLNYEVPQVENSMDLEN